MTLHENLTILAALNVYRNACEASMVKQPDLADYYKSEIGLIDAAERTVKEDYEAQRN